MTHAQAQASAGQRVLLGGGEKSLSCFTRNGVEPSRLTEQAHGLAAVGGCAQGLCPSAAERLTRLQVPQPHLLDERIGDVGVAVALANDEVGRHQLVDGRGDVVGGDLAAQRLAE